MPRAQTWIERDGVRIWTEAGGRGVPVLLCNGGPGCCDYLEPVADMVADLARVIRWEPRGCGRSDRGGPYDLETCLCDMEAIRQRYGIETWWVGGHSWGADLAVAYALTHPDRVLGIVGLSGGVLLKDREWSEQYHRRREAGEEVEPDYAYPPNMEVNRAMNASWKAFVRRPDLFRRVADLRMPALFVYGSDDIRPWWPVAQLAGLLPGGRFLLLDGAPHVLWLTHTSELREHIRAFIAPLSSSAAIRPATPADLPAILALERAIEAEGAMWGFRADSETGWAAHPLRWTFVAMEGTEVMGFVYGTLSADQDACVFPPGSRVLEISALIVARPFRDRAVGQALVAALKAQARADGFTHLRVYTAAKRFDDIVRFYRQCGFRPWYAELFMDVQEGACTANSRRPVLPW